MTTQIFCCAPDLMITLETKLEFGVEAYPPVHCFFTESLRNSYLLVLLCNPIDPLKESLHCQSSLKISIMPDKTLRIGI